MHPVGRPWAPLSLVTAMCGALALASPAAADAGGGAVVSDDSGIDYGAIDIGTTVGGGLPARRADRRVRYAPTGSWAGLTGSRSTTRTVT